MAGLSLGTCLSFCPESERARRQEQKLLHPLEIQDPSDKSNVVFAVKEYVRAGAGHLVPDPSDLRPPDVLVKTMHYLISKVLDRRDHPWHVLYEFVTNRIKAVRQDITFQQLAGTDITHIFQLACRFHIYAQHRLWGHPLNHFDPKLNLDHLQHCLVKVLAPSAATDIEEVAEFEAYYILSNLGISEVLNRALSLRPNIRLHALIQSSMAISLQFDANNFVRCCRLISQLSPLHRAAVLPQLYHIRMCALKTMSAAYNSKNGTFPIEILCDWILIDTVKDAAELCLSHGILVDEGNVLFRKGCFVCPDQVSTISLRISEFSRHPPSLLIFKP